MLFTARQRHWLKDSEVLFFWLIWYFLSYGPLQLSSCHERLSRHDYCVTAKRKGRRKAEEKTRKEGEERLSRHDYSISSQLQSLSMMATDLTLLVGDGLNENVKTKEKDTLYKPMLTTCKECTRS